MCVARTVADLKCSQVLELQHSADNEDAGQGGCAGYKQARWSEGLSGQALCAWHTNSNISKWRHCATRTLTVQ